MDNLARFYTQEKISQLLINKLCNKKPKRILELGIGDGALSLAAYKRWKKAQFYGIDIDNGSITNIKHKLPFVDIKQLSGLENDLQIKLDIENSSIDVAICNPPYLKYKASEDIGKLFEKVKLKSCIDNKFITTDIVFLAQNLLFLKEGSELGIILPDSILTNHYYSELRKDLLYNHNIKCIIQLPDNVFNKTEARTYILIIEKFGEGNSLVELSKADINGNIIESIYVDREKLISRMDFDFNFWSVNQIENKDSSIVLENIIISLIRGNKTKKELHDLNIDYFHTTSYSTNGYCLKFITEQEDFGDNLTLAVKGDILIARVGKRCIGKVAMVKSGCIPISDCIYRLRVPEAYQEILFASFISKEGQLWFEAFSHGVCARVISKSDLIKYKINK